MKKINKILARVVALAMILNTANLSVFAEETETETKTETVTAKVLTCETPEHTHTLDCYENKVLSCGQEETEGHKHTADCYVETEDSVLSCGKAESEGHTHTDECYQTVETLVCELDESEGHTHGESCYDEDGNLICELEESEGHTHGESCYATESVLICGQEESEGHTHGESCYTKASVLACELEESEGHTHDESCYTLGGLTCGFEKEHTHTDDCYGAEREITASTDDDGNATVTVTKVEEFTAEATVLDENGNVTEVKRDVTIAKNENGDLTATVSVGGIQVAAEDVTVSVEVTDSKVVNTTTSTKTEEGKTTYVTVVNEDGSTTTTGYTEYTTTYTTEVTTGYWVTYTVTYKVPISYTFESSDNCTVSVDVNQTTGVPTVTGVTANTTITAELTNEDGTTSTAIYNVTQNSETGKYYVQTADGVEHEVKPVITASGNGSYAVTWEFVLESNTEAVSYDVSKTEAEVIADFWTTATTNGLKYNDTIYPVTKGEDGKYYVKVDETTYEVTATATAPGSNSESTDWTVAWSFTIPGSDSVRSELPESATVSVSGDSTKGFTITLTDSNNDEKVLEESLKTLTVDDAVYTVTGVTAGTDGKTVTVTCTGTDGATYIFAMSVTADENSEGGYDVTYWPVTTIKQATIQDDTEVQATINNTLGKIETTNNQGETITSYFEYIAIVFPDGTYKYVKEGKVEDKDRGIFAGVNITGAEVTYSNSTITITVNTTNSSGTKQDPITADYTVVGLGDGYTITGLVYDGESKYVAGTTGDMYDCVNLYISGVIVTNALGETKVLTLTAENVKNDTESAAVDVSGSESVGGYKTISVSSLTGSETVFVTTSGGETVTMTYDEYLEAKAQGEPLELKGVVASSIINTPSPSDSEDTGDEETNPTPDTTDQVIPVIPVIPDEVITQIPQAEVPLTVAPATEILSEEVPLAGVPEEETPELETIADEGTPLSGVPKTGDDSLLWVVLGLTSGLGLAWLTLDGKKRKEIAE